MSESDAKTETNLYSLQEIAFNTALRNLGRYKELIKSKISPPFRKELYDKGVESVWWLTYEERHGLWTALPYLEPHKTAEAIDLRQFVWAMPKLEEKLKNCANFHDEDDGHVTLDKILRYLEQYAPNLKKLIIADSQTFDFPLISRNPHLEPSSIDLIVRMKNLTTISISGFTINFSGFVRICTECKNLQEIESMGILLDVPISNMKTILETFNTAFDHQEYNERAFPPKFGIVFKKTDSVEHYREGNVKLDDSNFVDSLPELTHLEAACGCNCENYHCHMKNLLRILNKVGGSLKKLTIVFFDPESKFTFKDIFEHCKSLESLHLERSYISDDDEPINSFGKLKELCWNNPDPDYPINLNSILCAPLLEKIVLTAYEFDLGDKEALFNRIRNGEICTNVKHFVAEHLAYVDEPVWDDFYRLVEAINMNLPEPIFSHLEIVRISRRRRSRRRRWQ